MIHNLLCADFPISIDFSSSENHTLYLNGFNGIAPSINNQEIAERLSNLISVHLGDNIETVSSEAFYGCKNLNTVEMPKVISVMSDSAFRGCSSLSSIYMPNIRYLGDRALYECGNLTSVNDLSNVVEFGTYALRDCGSLISADIRSCNTGIRSGTFYNCKNLHYIYMPNIADLQNNGIHDCMSLSVLDFRGRKASDPPAAFDGSISTSYTPISCYVDNRDIWLTANGWKTMLSDGRIKII